MKLIFLDIDGVLNCEQAYKEGFCTYVKLPSGRRYQTFYPPSKEKLNYLIELTGADIVISSSWRHSGLDYMKEVWAAEGMNGEIKGITPDFSIKGLNGENSSVPRGVEIDWYVEIYNPDTYVIIDDDTDMLYNQRNNFVWVEPSPRNRHGFNMRHFNKALKILTK